MSRNGSDLEVHPQSGFVKNQPVMNSFLHNLKPKKVFRQYFWAQIVGQGFVGVANILVTIIPPRVAAVWFSEDELSRAIGTLLSAQVIGNALGLLIPNLSIKERPKFDE